MSRLFDNYVIVDWSAAAAKATGADSIWIGVLRRDVRLKLRFEADNPPTRHAAMDRLAGLLDEFARRGDRTLLGFDFPMGYPAGTAAALGLASGPDLPPWAAMRAFLAREIKDKADNSNNRFQVAARMNRLISGGPFPFWGCPPRDALTTLQPKKTRAHGPGDLAEFRLTDRAAKGTSPVWKLYTAGSAGSQALTGIARLEALRARWPSMRLWPFETGLSTLTREALEGVDVVAAEVWPSLLPVTPAPGEVRDMAQTRTLARHFADLDEAGRLARLFDAPAGLSAEQQALVVGEEGWILGA